MSHRLSTGALANIYQGEILTDPVLQVPGLVDNSGCGPDRLTIIIMPSNFYNFLLSPRYGPFLSDGQFSTTYPTPRSTPQSTATNSSTSPSSR